MAKAQPWPGPIINYADIIMRQNDLLLLALYVSYYEIKRGGNLGLLAGLMPILSERVSVVYEAAIQVGPYIENRPSDKLPLWAKQSNRIVKEYPALMMRLRGLEPKIRQQRIIEIKRILFEMFTLVALIQTQLLKIAMDKKTLLLLPVKKIEEMSQEIEQ